MYNKNKINILNIGENEDIFIENQYEFFINKIHISKNDNNRTFLLHTKYEKENFKNFFQDSNIILNKI